MIQDLKTFNIGPLSSIEAEFGKRLNLFTGDNGLGKSFILDTIWWAVTQTWPAELNPGLTSGKIALPRDKKKKAEIIYTLSTDVDRKKRSAVFESKSQSWRIQQERSSGPGLVFYALADGSFAVWDPARNSATGEVFDGKTERPAAYVFNPKEVWDGLQQSDGTWLCNGLIRDWAGWQKEKGQAFESLAAMLAALSPPQEESIIPGELTRISLNDVRDMPTIKMPYGQEVPVVHASSGIRRIMSIAYFLVWCWEEHLKAKELLGETEETRLLFIIDEVEAHLHPKWQRAIVPALMNVLNLYMKHSDDLQLLVTSHSPLIMASAEGLFDSTLDAWFDFDLESDHIILSKRPFVRRGEVRNWLASEAFDMKSGYPINAERILDEASKALTDEAFDAVKALELDSKLRSVLSDTDPFWMRWRFVGEKKGWLS